jgi:hypothetical protein
MSNSIFSFATIAISLAATKLVSPSPSIAAEVCKTICLSVEDWATAKQKFPKNYYWCPGTRGAPSQSKGSGCPLGRAFRDRCGTACLPAGAEAVFDSNTIGAHYIWKF